MKIGASTGYGIINKSVIESVNELEKAGFDAVELEYEYHNLFTSKEIRALKNKKTDFSMHCPYIGVMFTHLNSDFSAPQIKLIEKSLDAATRVGCSHYVMHGGLIPGIYLMIENKKTRNFFVDLFIKRFRDVFERYSKKGLKIVIENMEYENMIGGNLSDIVGIQKAIPEIGFCFDVAHSELRNQTKDILNKINIDYVHIHDNNLESDEHNAIGEGKINFKKIISKLKNNGFDGKLILENTSYEECKKSFSNLKKIV